MQVVGCLTFVSYFLARYKNLKKKKTSSWFLIHTELKSVQGGKYFYHLKCSFRLPFNSAARDVSTTYPKSSYPPDMSEYYKKKIILFVRARDIQKYMLMF